MDNLLGFGVFLFIWMISQSVLYLIIYYKYIICNDIRYYNIYKSSKFLCYIFGIIISLFILKICFDNFNIINMIKKIKFIVNIEWIQFYTLIISSFILLIFIFFIESLIGIKYKIYFIKQYKKIEFKRRKISLMDSITIVAFAPCVEEILFRGYIYEELRIFYGVEISIILVGVLFGLAHIRPKKVFFSVIVSIIFSFCYIWGGIYMAIIAHIFYNFLSTYSIKLKGGCV